ncbi:anoctamin-7 [Trichonephila inaurata madagascariensis]|uniref:Anoctamin n=1 Tax=Trichonephila inaurata madagascariensis TaxID=2747483 RepID=A0A8X7CM93_9ARAC|nr:anoctamin-7 [Trichonephila inaurata madagascariensis]
MIFSDYVLVYEESSDDRPQPKGYAQKTHKHEAWRKKFMANLVKAGLHMEEETVESEANVIHFIKLSAPWPVLVHYAEQLCMRAPLQAHPNPSHNWSEHILKIPGQRQSGRVFQPDAAHPDRTCHPADIRLWETPEGPNRHRPPHRGRSVRRCFPPSRRFYTGWLFPAAVVGLAVFLYGVLTMHNDTPSNEVCNSEKTFLMCPRCEENYGCAYWYLSDICMFSKLSYLFDHPGTVFYAVFVSFWAVSFLEYWKRKSASLAHHWDCMDFEEEEERPRPEFAAKAPCVERNPITGIKEPSFPKSVRMKRIAVGSGAILVMMALVMIFIVAVILYRVLVSIFCSGRIHFVVPPP